MIRDAQPDVTIGFFLHVPFPSYELFRLMPTKWQEQIMEGIQGADLVGFHTIDYASHFLTSAQMILGLGNEMHAVRYKNRLVKVDVFPISIDFDRFYDAYDTPGVVANRNTLHERFGNKKVIFSVDRLDYTKGISNRLMAFDNFLKTYPQYVEKVVFILVIVPSRDSIAKYNEKKKFIDEYIGNFNSSTGTVLWQPIIYQYNSLEFDELVALYSCCDLALITPLRDGMNLVAKEFVASRKDKRGVLVISEMAGAARELTDALTINPNDIEEMAMKIKVGLEMSGEEQAKAMTTMQQRIKQYDVHAWADDFLYQLKKIKEKQKEFEVKYIDEQISEKLRKQYRESTNRLFLLDYDGTLISFSSMPEMAKPGKELLALLNELATSPGNTVYLISGRDSKTLDSWFGQVPVNIVAEHGAKIKEQGGKWHNELGSPVKWKTSVADIMEQYVKRCVNSFIETKDFSVAWHYRNANPEQGRLRASELYQQLEGYISSLGLQVLMGNKVIEVRNSGINKGYATKKILAGSNYDFIITFGDDTTDEDMFMELADVPQASTIKVGPEPSYARYNVATPEAVIKLLESINRASGNDEKIQNAG
jgi:trehalose 6-phosphate synthase/phosphatase